MGIIQTRSLSKHYGRRVGVSEVDLDVSAGEIFGFLGPNGSGKTTMIRMLLGFLKPSTGSAEILDLDCFTQSARIKKSVGYVPGDLRLYSWMTALNGLELVQRIRGVEIVSRGLELCERFGLEPDVRVRKMSRGTRQKLGLVLALAHDPALLVLDEPSSGLDPLVQDLLGDLVKGHASRGGTVFFSSHSLAEVESLCHRVAIVRKGRLIASETLESLRSRARREVRMAFEDARSAREAAIPEFLERAVLDGAEWRGELLGESAELVRWAASRPLRDLEIGPPGLESLFRSYYGFAETERES